MDVCIDTMFFPDGAINSYKLTQTDNEIQLSFKIPGNLDINDTIYEFNSEQNSIRAGINGSPLVICGKLYNNIIQDSHEIQDDLFVITLQKEIAETWPILIISPIGQDIDARSLFILGIFKDAKKERREAFSCFKRSAEAGFLPAIVLIADTYLGDETNPYDIAPDPAIAIQMIQKIPSENMDSEILYRLIRALLIQKRNDEALQLLQNATFKLNDETQYLYATLLSPILGEGQNPELAVSLLKEIASTYPKAKLGLALHLFSGLGIKKDKKLALQYYQEAIKEDTTLPKPPEITQENSKGPIFVSAFLGVALIGSLVLLYLKSKKR